MASAQTGALQQYFKDGGVTHLLVKGADGKAEEKPLSECEFLNKHCALYFSAHWCGPCRQYTPQLAEQYKKGDLGLTIIFNSWDRDQAAFESYYNTHPWAAIPFRFKDALEKSEAFTQPRGIPSLMLFNEKGEMYQPNGRSMLSMRPFPYEDPTWEEFLGAVIDQEHKPVDVATLKSKKYFGLYFSAHWCPPCRNFTPKLAKFVKEFKETRDDFEFIFCSSDRDEASFKEYFKTMGFLGLNVFGTDQGKAIKAFLSDKMGVRGIPHLAIVDSEGNLISKNGRTMVEEDPKGLEFPWKLPAVQDIAKTLEGINELPSFVMFCETKSAEEQETLLGYLNAHATEQEAKDERECMHFISKSKSEIGSRVAAITGNKGDGLILLSIQSTKYYFVPLPDSNESIGKVWKEFQEGTLQGERLQM